MNISELVYDLKEHLDTYCQTYDDYILTYNQTEVIYYLINDLQQENQEYKEVINKAIELLGNYKHYSTSDEKQNSDNEDLVNKAFDVLKEVK